MPTPIRQFNTQTHYLADGVTTAWPFSFTGGYIAPEHVRAQTRSPTGTLAQLTINPEDDLIGEFQLRITPPVAAGYELMIYRATPRDLPLVDFTDGSQLPEVNLDIVARQSIFVAAESADWLGVSSTEDLTALATGAAAAAAEAAASSLAASASATTASGASVSAVAAATTAGTNQTSAAASAAAAASSASAAAGAVSNLASLASASQGAGMVAFSHAVAYPDGTAGKALKRELSLADAPYNVVGDGTTDWTAQVLAAVAALPGGGRIHVPRGWIRVTSSIPLHSGLEFYGEGCTNLTYGVPTNNERPSHIFLDSETGSLFTHAPGVQLESVTFRNISLGARLFPNTTPRGTTTCFNLSGSWPNDIKHLTFESCQFSNFGGYGFRVRDPLAPSANPDWNVCPVTMTDCTFYYNSVSIEIEADNADCWLLQNVGFFQNLAGYGINLKRGGMLTMINCFGGGGTMLTTSGSIRDSVLMIGCQFEDALAMLYVQDTMATQQTYRPIKMISCVIEAPIVLAAPCRLITEGCRWVNNLEVTAAGVQVDSLFDSFLASTAFNIVAGSSVRNFLTEGGQLPTGVRGQILNGMAVVQASASPTTGSWKLGDIAWHSAPGEGKPAGWRCVSDGTPGGWVPLAQTSSRTYAGNPTGVIAPYFFGEELYNSTAGTWYKSKGTALADWVLIG